MQPEITGSGGRLFVTGQYRKQDKFYSNLRHSDFKEAEDNERMDQRRAVSGA